MSKLGIYDGDVIAANNSDIDGTDSTGTTGKVKDGDNYSRSIVSWLKRFANDLGGANTVGGTANAMTATLAGTASAIVNGLRFTAPVATANAGATTLVVTPGTGSAFASKSIKKYDGTGNLVALAAGDNAPGLREYVYLSSPDCYVLLNPAQEARYAPGTLYGLTLSNNGSDATNDIDIAVGSARSSDDTTNIDLLTALTKQLDAVWAVGTNAGMLASGAAITNTTYHIFLIKRPDTGVVDIAADTSVTGANIATNTNAAYTKIRRIGSIIRSGGSILAFSQRGDQFLFNVVTIDINSNNPGTSAVTRTISVPLGIVTDAILVIELINSGSAAAALAAITSLAVSDQAVTSSGVRLPQTGLTETVAGGVLHNNAQLVVRTNTSSQVRSRLSYSDANVTLLIQTDGWIDTRGRI